MPVTYNYIGQDKVRETINNCVAFVRSNTSQDAIGTKLQQEVSKLVGLADDELSHRIQATKWRAFGQIAKLDGFVSMHKLKTKVVANLPNEDSPSEKYIEIPDLQAPDVEAFEGYDQEIFLLYNLYFYLDLYIRITLLHDRNFLPTEERTIYEFLKSEMELTANAYSILYGYNSCLDNATELADLVSSYVGRLVELMQVNQRKIEYCFPCGYETHALYLTLIVCFQSRTLTIRLDNSMKERPYIISKINIDNSEHIASFKQYLQNVCGVIRSGQAQAMNVLFDLEDPKILPPVAEETEFTSLSPQEVPNCVVEGYRFGLWHRLQTIEGTRGFDFFNWLMYRSVMFYASAKAGRDTQEFTISKLPPSEIDVEKVASFKDSTKIMEELARAGISWKGLLSRCVSNPALLKYIKRYYLAKSQSEERIFTSILDHLFSDMDFSRESDKQDPIDIKDGSLTLTKKSYLYNLLYLDDESVKIKIIFSTYIIDNCFTTYNFSVVRVEGLDALTFEQSQRLKENLKGELLSALQIDWLEREPSRDEDLVICNAQIERAIVAKFLLELTQKFYITPPFSRDANLFVESFLQQLHFQNTEGLSDKEKYILDRTRFPHYERFEFNAKSAGDNQYVVVSPKQIYMNNKLKKHRVEMAASLFPLYQYLVSINEKGTFKNEVLETINQVFAWFQSRSALIQHDFSEIWKELEGLYDNYNKELQTYLSDSIDFIQYSRESILTRAGADDAQADCLAFAHNRLYVKSLGEICRITERIVNLEKEISEEERVGLDAPNYSKIIEAKLITRADLANEKHLAQVKANIFTSGYCLNHSALFHLKRLQIDSESSLQNNASITSIHSFIGSILQLIGFRLQYGNLPETNSDQIGIWYIYNALKYSKCIGELIFGSSTLAGLPWGEIILGNFGTLGDFNSDENLTGCLKLAKEFHKGDHSQAKYILNLFSALNIELHEFFTESEYFLLLSDIRIAKFIEDYKEISERAKTSSTEKNSILSKTKQLQAVLKDRSIKLINIINEGDNKLLQELKERLKELEPSNADIEKNSRKKRVADGIRNRIQEIESRMQEREDKSIDITVDLYMSLAIKLLILCYQEKYRKKQGLWGEYRDGYKPAPMLYSISEKQMLIHKMSR